MNKPKYHEKCSVPLNTDQFAKLNHDHAKKIETKIQKVLKKIITNLTSGEYLQLDPTGSYPEKLHGTPRIHKVLSADNIDKLPIRTILSNINNSTFELAKHLAKLKELLLLCTKEVNLLTGIEFIHKMMVWP